MIYHDLSFVSRQRPLGVFTSLLSRAGTIRSWFGPVGFVALCALAAASAAQLRADVRLPGIFSDHMVLQQGRSLPVWGWAQPGEAITVTFHNQKVSTVAEKGTWTVRLKPEKAGGPYTLKVAGKNTIEMQDVLVGEVWICSGQSNMEWPLSRSFEPQNDIETSANNMIRLFTVPKLKARSPVNDVKASWQLCNPDTVKNFSAVGYYFGRALQQARKVPVGLIHSSWGGSPAEVWMREEVLAANPVYQREILDSYPPAWRTYQRQLASYEIEKAEADKKGTRINRNRPGPPWRPSELYNGMIAPLIPYAIQGAIWYQGESNAERAYQYRTLFPDMITNWRHDWGLSDLTFLAVQLAPFKNIQPEPQESSWAELREAQWIATQKLPKVGLAVITDVGDPKDIHPTRKLPVGERLAMAARGIAYREHITYSGPAFKGVRFQGDQAVLSFHNTGRGLESRGGELTGFAICGADKKFVWAKAIIKNNRVCVTSPEVSRPVAVRYGWADCPVVNLWNKDGLPACPFRTDDFPLITGPKK
jgi:sialate O-acetylesterase